MDLFVITPEINHSDELWLVQALFENGLSKLHLRKPSYTPADYRSYLQQIRPRFYSRISVHENFELLKEFPGLGIHVTSRTRADKDITEILNQVTPSTFSASFHSWKEIEYNECRFDYVFISPVFDSISKKGYKASIELAEVKNIKKKMNAGKILPASIIGLGGIDGNHIGKLYQKGFDGAALLGAVWESADPLASFLQIQECVKKTGDG